MGEAGSLLAAGMPLGKAARSLPEQLADLLLAEMEAGRLGAGDRLKEEELSRRHAVSRATVREALAALAEQGHVVKTPRSGARVAEFSRQDLDDLFDLRAALLAFAAGRCARRRRDLGRLAELQGLVAQLEAIAEDPASEPRAFAAMSVRAQALLIAWSGNRHLPDAYERLAGIGAWQTIRGRSTSFLDAEGRRQSAEDWRRLADRIAGGDTSGSERAARRLLEHSAERVRRHFDGVVSTNPDA